MSSSSGSELAVVLDELMSRDPSSRIVIEMLNLLVITGSGTGDGGGDGGNGTLIAEEATATLAFFRRPSNLRNIVRIGRSVRVAV